MRAAGHLLVGALVLGAGGAARAQPPQPGPAPDGRPGGILVPHATAAPSARLTLLAQGGYGYIEPRAPEPAGHHRLLGGVALSIRPVPFLAIGGGVAGTWDFHPADDEGGRHTSGVGRAFLTLRAGGEVVPELSLAGDVHAQLNGGDAPDIDILATALSLRGVATLHPPGSGLSLSLIGGYRLDGSSRTVEDVSPPFRTGARVSLGVAELDRVLLGLGASGRFGDAEVFGEVTFEPYVGGQAPDLSLSPLRFGAGARYLAGEAVLSFAVLVNALERPPVGDPDGPLLAVEPRVQLLAGIGWRPSFGSPPPTAPPPREVLPGPAVPPEAPGRLEVWVTDADGAPVEAAVVTVRDMTDAVVRRRTADDDGVAPLGDLPPGRYRVSAAAEGFADVELAVDLAAGERDRVTLTLAPSVARGALRGLVRDFRGRAIRGAEVRVDGNAARAETDRDGVFEVELAPGEHVIEIEARGYRPQRREVSVEENGVTVLNVDLRRAR
ncbi:MAG: collagen binding domain-containing protein [Sandaracinaceae bacterium]